MNTALTVIASVLVFGFLIFIHEFGHYITARIFRVTIEEFSIGMGPRIITWISKKTGIRYSVALFPIGGFVSMPGENGEDIASTDTESDSDEKDESSPFGQKDYSNDPNTFGKKPVWQRFIVTAAGAFVNIVAGFLAMILLTSLPTVAVGGTTVGAFYTEEQLGAPPVSESQGLMIDDKIVAIDGKRVTILDELSYEIMRRGTEPIDITLIRDGEEMTLYDVSFVTESAEGQSFGVMDFKVYRDSKSFGNVLKHSFKKSFLIVRMCWESLYDLIRGRYTIEAVSGPVGISSAIGNAAAAGFASLLYITVLISINLGVMNLLPIPALDGGRLLTQIIEMITRKRMPAKVEMIINGVGLALLLAFSAFIMIKDVIMLIV